MTEARSSADALREILAQIDAGQITATSVERAFIAGALTALEQGMPPDSEPDEN